MVSYAELRIMFNLKPFIFSPYKFDFQQLTIGSSMIHPYVTTTDIYRNLFSVNNYEGKNRLQTGLMWDYSLSISNL